MDILLGPMAPADRTKEENRHAREDVNRNKKCSLLEVRSHHPYSVLTHFVADVSCLLERRAGVNAL